MATKKMAARKKTRKAVTVEFDEDGVRAVMAKVLDASPEDLDIDDGGRGFSSFGVGTFYEVRLGRGAGYVVAENDDAARALAIAVAKQDLEESSENFDPDFIQSHINLDRLRRDLHSDVHSSIYDNLHEEAKRRPMDFLKEHDLDIPEPSEKQLREHAALEEDEEGELARLRGLGDAEDRWIEIGEEPEVPDSEVDALADKLADDQLRDPVGYLVDMMGEEEGRKQAADIGGLDIDAAAEEVVSTDGEGHFLSGYDGHMHDGPGGIVYWRVD